MELVKIIEKSKDRVSFPNKCFNSGIINALYKKSTGGYDFECVKISICYGKPKTFVFWKDRKVFREITISTFSKTYKDYTFDGKTLTTKYFIIELINN